MRRNLPAGWAAILLAILACQGRVGDGAASTPGAQADLKAEAWRVLAARVFEHRSDRTCVYAEWEILNSESFLANILRMFDSDFEVEPAEPLTDEQFEALLLASVQAQQPDWNPESVTDLFLQEGNSEAITSLIPLEFGLRSCDGPFKEGDYRYSFTPMGFSADLEDAIVYVELYCGPLCAGGTLYLLRHGAQGWSIIDEVMLWIS